MISKMPDAKRIEYGIFNIVSKYKGEERKTIVKLEITYTP